MSMNRLAMVMVWALAIFVAISALPCRSFAVPPFASLLRRYPVRPPWKVAGVDYAVGVPAGTRLRDPATLNVPGISVDTARHLVTLSGDGATLDGYDFAQQGGWGVRVQGRNEIIRRCNFRVGANNLLPIDGGKDATNLTVADSTIDGGGAGPNAEAIYAVLNFNGQDLTATRNWFRYTPVDAIDFNGGGRLIVQDNLFHDLGYSIGAHADSVQFTRGAVHDAIISGNTVYDPQPKGGFPVLGGEGLQVEAQLGGSILHTRLARNTIITTGPLKTAGYLIAIRQDSGSVLDGIDVVENYLDGSGGWGPFYPPTGKHLVFQGNVDLVSGRVIPKS